MEIDRAMRLGFNWEMGPFELWDAAGVEATVERMKKEGRPVAANVEKLLAAGNKSWYADAPAYSFGACVLDLRSGGYNRSSVRRSVVGGGSKEIQRGDEEKSGRVAGGSWRWHGVYRVSFQDECHRRGHYFAGRSKL